jgi:hypothetical protein
METLVAAIDVYRDISPALYIEGWMSPIELAWLAQRAAEHERIVEVGSYFGRSTRSLADHTPGWVLAFDDWGGVREPMVDVETGKAVTCPSRETIWNKFQINLADHICSGKVRILNGDHADCSIIPPCFLAGTDAEKPDMVFIDGGHEYQEVSRDLEIWVPRLSTEGLLCGHDLSRADVSRALTDRNLNWKKVEYTDLWLIQK